MRRMMGNVQKTILENISRGVCVSAKGRKE